MLVLPSTERDDSSSEPSRFLREPVDHERAFGRALQAGEGEAIECAS